MAKCLPAIFAAALIIAAGGAGFAQTMPTDPSAASNVRQSERYEQVLHSNPSFAKKRMQEECGPISDPQLHAQCVASFGQSGGRQ